MSTEIVVMPKLVVTIEGKVKKSNLPAFQKAAKKYVGAINRVFKTDDDFGQAEVDIKSLKEAEKLVKVESENIVNQTHDINEVLKTLAFIGEEFRQPRLEIEKEVKEQKDSIRIKIMKEATDEVQAHSERCLTQINNEFPLELRYNSPDFYAVIKGLRTIESVKDNVKKEKDAAIFSMTTVTNDILNKLVWFKDQGYMEHKALFVDMPNIIYTEMQGFLAMVTLRVNNHLAAEKEKEEKRREEIRIEEEAKAKAKVEAEAKAKAEAEEKAKAEEKPKETEPENPDNVIDLVSNPATVKETDPGEGYLPSRQATQTSVTKKEAIKLARSDCEKFMVKYMKLDEADLIRGAMVNFLEKTDWVEN